MLASLGRRPQCRGIGIWTSTGTTNCGTRYSSSLTAVAIACAPEQRVWVRCQEYFQPPCCGASATGVDELGVRSSVRLGTAPSAVPGASGYHLKPSVSATTVKRLGRGDVPPFSQFAARVRRRGPRRAARRQGLRLLRSQSLRLLPSVRRLGEPSFGTADARSQSNVSPGTYSGAVRS